MTATGTGSSTEGRPPRRSRLAVRLAVLGFSLILSVAALEIVLRALGYGPGTGRVQYIAHPDLFSIPAPNQDVWVGEDDPASGHERYRVHINDYGQRGPDYPLARSPGERRVVVLGDSMTYGLGVGDDQTFVALAEADLRAAGRQGLRMVNAGVPKYATINYLRWMQSQLQRFDPDVVVIAVFMGNDMGIPQHSIMSIPVPMENLLRRSAIGYWVYMRYRLSRAKADLADQMGMPFEDIDDHALLELAGVVESELTFDQKRQLWEHSLAHLAEARRLADAAGVQLIALLIPTVWMLEGDPPLPGWLAGRVEELGIPVISPIPELAPLGREAYLPWDPGHFSAAGHRATAAALEAGLAEHGALEPKP